MQLTRIPDIGSFTGRDANLINTNFSQLASLAFTPGNVVWLNPDSGSDQWDGTTPENIAGTTQGPKQTLSAAYDLLREGMNDVVALISDGTTSGTARVNSAFTWSKNAAHLVGIASGVNISSRARIAPTATTTAFANFFTVSGSGCFFQNIQWFHGFNTGTTSAICLTVTGSRNLFLGCAIDGMGDEASAQNSGSRSLKISGGGQENIFRSCAIGIDTVTRTVANASVELAGATARNQFIDCVFPFMTSAATPLGILGTGNGCVDRFNLFQRCLFVNAIKSTSTTMSALASFTTSAPGGLNVFQGCMSIGITEWGDTNGLANSYVDMAAPSASAGGIGVNPS